MVKIKDNKQIFIRGKAIIPLRIISRLLVFVFFPFALFLLFLVSNEGKNFLSLVGFSETNKDVALASDVIDETPKEEIPILFEEEDGPVDFLEEVLPLTSPDPNRVSYDVVETDTSGSKNIAGLFSVRDTSDSGLDLEAELYEDIDLEITDTSEPTVLIYHTHSCEAYLKSNPGFYYADDSFRNPSSEKNIALVGQAMAAALNAAGINTIHDTTLHDSPSFNGAYSRSAETVQAYLEKYPSIKITIDVHRDAMVTEEGTAYKPTTVVDGKKAAQMMIIAGSDPTGELEYDNWYPNLLFALKLQEKAESMYSGLMRPLMFCQRSYNMWLTDSSFLVEVGTQVNTFSEAEYSGSLMGNILAELINSLE